MRNDSELVLLLVMYGIGVSQYRAFSNVQVIFNIFIDHAGNPGGATAPVWGSPVPAGNAGNAGNDSFERPLLGCRTYQI